MSEFLSSLNPEQQVAVEHTEGPLLILAGAGSGKTRVIAHRIAYLIAEKNVAPWNILAVTFTNKAAQEMRERVQRLLRDQELPSLPLVSTFHSLCVRILRQDIEKLNEKYTRTFTIYDQDDSLRLIKNCIKDLGYDEKQLGLRATQSTISSAKNRGEDVETFAARADYVDERRAAMARVFAAYEERLHANNALDFDDLLIKTVRLLRNAPEVREKYNNKFRYILVDEYQDTNSLQFALISLLTEKQQNIAVVGDEDQSIYKWRGADITNILNFEKHFPNTKTIRLEQNYRSTQTILDVAGAVVKHNIERKGKKLWTSNPQGERIRYYQAFDADAEARWVASKILEHRRDEYELRAAVLYRTNSQSRVFEEAMRRAGLPYNIVGGFSFYERMEVRDIIAYLKLALNPNDSIALQRVINSPARGIGKQTLDELTRRSRNGVQSPTSNVPTLDDDARVNAETEQANAETERLNTGSAGVPPAMSTAGANYPTAGERVSASTRRVQDEVSTGSGSNRVDRGNSPTIREGSNDRGSSPTVREGADDPKGPPPDTRSSTPDSRLQTPDLSLWDTIGVVINDPQNLSTRAVSALKSFRRIILRLSEMAGVATQDSSADTQHPTPDTLVSDIVKAAILETGYENSLKSEKTDEAEARLENLQELVNAAVDYDELGIEGLREFIDHSALVSDADQYKENAVVTLMTAHSAKGLEFPLVFIVGLEDGLLPHSRSATDPAELEEERRLMYVAMTRAERFLYVTHAMKRRVYGEELASEPSQFLNEMPLDLIDDLSLGKSWLYFARGSHAIDYEHGEYRERLQSPRSNVQSPAPGSRSPTRDSRLETPDSSPDTRHPAPDRGSRPTVREGVPVPDGYRKERGKYAGKTYDSVDSIAEFFKQRASQLGNTSGSFQSTRERADREKVQGPRSKVQRPISNTRRPSPGTLSSTPDSRLQTPDSSPGTRSSTPDSRLQTPDSSRGTRHPTPDTHSSTPDFSPGSYVKHAKYGRGLVLRREGVGDSSKLTVTFPGYGQKKLVEKYANLEKA